jgi:beta-glucosidase
MVFPDGFLWGAATASYQIEGAHDVDGRRPSVWDVLCRRPGKVFDGHTGDRACDHYHRHREDVALMREVGLQAYRFSIAWPRVLPDGTGAVNTKGLDFYDRLVDDLLAAGIRPLVTLFHWDLPYDLYRRGSWMNRDSIGWFTDYVEVVGSALADRVQDWITFNEPQCCVGLYAQGWHAPGEIWPMPDVLRATHHLLVAHGRTVRVLRAISPAGTRVSYAPVGVVKIPADPTSAADVAAARAATFDVPKADSLWNTSWWLDPVYLGKYPAVGLERYAAELEDHVLEGDMETIAQPLDYQGVNIYHAEVVRAGSDGQPVEVQYGPQTPRTNAEWPVSPGALEWGPRFLYERYGLPVMITENGIANTDWVALDGSVHDPQRIDYTARYLRSLHRAIETGVPVLGYMHWTFMDNFEWAEGYRRRFGLIHVDFDTLVRTPKDSARWYAEVIRTNGANL